MGCNWKSAPLGELVSYVGKGIVPIYTDDTSSSNVCVLGQKCVRNQRIDFSQSRFHDASKKPVKIEKFVYKGDILINATGVGSAGRVAQVIHEPVVKSVTDGHVLTLRSRGIDPFYLGYAVKLKQSVIEKMAEGSTGQTEMNRARLLNEVIVTYPDDLNMQAMIAGIGLALDEKITLNNRTNDYLAV